MPEPAHDALDALRARLEETRLHAERLAAETAQARRAAEDRAGPADGSTEPGPEPGATTPIDLQAVGALLETLRDLVPPELQQQLAEVTRQVLLLVRALIDWWVDRLDAVDPARPPGAAPGGRDARHPGAGAPDGSAVRDIPVR